MAWHKVLHTQLPNCTHMTYVCCHLLPSGLCPRASLTWQAAQSQKKIDSLQWQADLGIGAFESFSKTKTGHWVQTPVCVSAPFTELSQMNRYNIIQEGVVTIQKRDLCKSLIIHLFWNTEAAPEFERMFCWNEPFLWENSRNNYPAVLPNPQHYGNQWPATDSLWLMWTEFYKA